MGIGFEAANAEKMFDKFTSLKRLGTLGEETNGFGLFLTRKIVEKHNGTITAFSEGVNKGARFRVSW
jgi:signal transduction histidine kinase